MRWRRRGARDQRPDGDLAAPPRMQPRDLVDEAVAGLFARPGRAALTVLGTVVGLASLVATIGLSTTAGNRIAGRFDELAATEVTVTVRPSAAVPGAQIIPWDAPARIERLNGVVAAGNVSRVDVGDHLVSASPVDDPQGNTSFRLSVHAASPGLFAAVRATLGSGRLLDEAQSERGEDVVVLGPNAAEQLGITSVRSQPAVRIGDDIYSVIGVLDGVERVPELLGSVILPEGTAAARYRLVAPETVVIETAIGAARVVADQVALALRPDSPRDLRVRFPPEPTRVREQVENDLNLLLLVLSSVALLVGAIGIANVTLVSVMERTGEIGLRRALGASRRHIALQFLMESATIGLVGGILGACVGTLVVVGVSAYQDWTPVMNPAVQFAAPVVGLIVGLASGLYPSRRAAAMEPVEALPRRNLNLGFGAVDEDRRHTRTDSQAQTRQRIVEAAARLFMAKGVDAVSLEDVGREAGGFSKGAVYSNFANKPDLVFAIVEDHYQRLDYGLRSGIKASTDIESLRAAALAWYHEFLDVEATWSRSLPDIAHFARTNDAARDRLLQLIDVIRADIVGMLQAKEQAFGVQFELPPDTVVDLAVALVAGLAMRAMLQQESTEDLFAAALAALLRTR